MEDEDRPKILLDIKDRHKTLLDIDYNKLLSYLAGVLVFFFMLFEISKEVSEQEQSLHPYFVFMISGASLVGIIFFLGASYHNYKEIIKLENQLGISEILDPSWIFSKPKKHTTDREISPILICLIAALGILSIMIFLYIIYKVNFFKIGLIFVFIILFMLYIWKKGIIKDIMRKLGVIE